MSQDFTAYAPSDVITAKQSTNTEAFTEGYLDTYPHITTDGFSYLTNGESPKWLPAEEFNKLFTSVSSLCASLLPAKPKSKAAKAKTVKAEGK